MSPSSAPRLEIGAAGRILEHRATPWIVVAMTMVIGWWLWGSWSAEPWVYDEAAYLLQARIFASLHWAAAGRPLPEFFEQIHVFVTPRLIPKYPPGHAIAMVPGVWLGIPGLIPLLFGGLSAGLLFALARRLTNGLVAAMTWLVWITAPMVLTFLPSYMSQATTTLVWLAGWWCLLQWKDHARTGWLLLFSALVAWGAITRPFSMVAFAIPAGICLLSELYRRRGLILLAPMVAVTLPILAIPLLWSWRTTGVALPTPYSEYSRVYVPWNMPGFHIDSTPPLRAETPAIERMRIELLPIHRQHTVARLPVITLQRLRGTILEFWGVGAWRWWLVPVAVIGLIVAAAPVRIAAASTGLLVLTYLYIAHRPRWAVYHMEGMPVLAFATAVGFYWLAAVVGRGAGRWWPERSATIVLGLCLAAILVGVTDGVRRATRVRAGLADLRRTREQLTEAVAKISGPAIVFIRTRSGDGPLPSYVQNEPDLDRARVWLVDDRGSDNERLRALAPERRAFLFDPVTASLVEQAR